MLFSVHLKSIEIKICSPRSIGIPLHHFISGLWPLPSLDTAQKKLQEVIRFLNCWTDSIIVVIVALVAYSSYVYLPHYTMSLLAYMNILDSENVLVDYHYTDSRIWIQSWNSKILWLILWFLLPLIVYYVYYKVLKMDMYIILVD